MTELLKKTRARKRPLHLQLQRWGCSRLVRFLTEEENGLFIVLYVNAQLAFSLKIKKIFPVSGQKY
jgi:hypothetical protein